MVLEGTSLVASVSKSASFADVLAGKAKPSGHWVTECFLLRLPVELRHKIWYHYFVRELGIVPTWVRRTLHDRPFDDQRQYHDFYGHFFEGAYNYYSTYVDETWTTKTWTSVPSHAQRGLIENGDTELPDSMGKDGVPIQHLINKRRGGKIEIINTIRVKRAPFRMDERNFSILYTCKQINREASAVLYGSNTFIFDIRGNAEQPYQWDSKDFGKFRDSRSQIPGLISNDEEGNAHAVEAIFDKNTSFPKYLEQDPLAFFFRKIGRRNASFIKKLKIVGHLKVYPSRLLGSWDTRPRGLARILPIHSLILNRVCPNLTHLTLHMGQGEPTTFMIPGEIPRLYHGYDWTQYDDYPGDHQKSDEDKIDMMVERLVKGLPCLQHLQLGDYKEPEIPEGDLEWGKSQRWVEYVEMRPKQVRGPVGMKEKENDLVGGAENLQIALGNDNGHSGGERSARGGIGEGMRGGRGGHRGGGPAPGGGRGRGTMRGRGGRD